MTSINEESNSMDRRSVNQGFNISYSNLLELDWPRRDAREATEFGSISYHPDGRIFLIVSVSRRLFNTF